MPQAGLGLEGRPGEALPFLRGRESEEEWPYHLELKTREETC